MCLDPVTFSRLTCNFRKDLEVGIKKNIRQKGLNCLGKATVKWKVIVKMVKRAEAKYIKRKKSCNFVSETASNRSFIIHTVM